MSYPTEPIVNKGELPDLFTPPGMDRITSREQWPAAAAAWRDLVINCEYGGMPPQPEKVEMEGLCLGGAKRIGKNIKFHSYRIHCQGGKKPFTFCVQVFIPPVEGNVPVIITGDRCWWYVDNNLVKTIMDAGCAFMIFNRTELAADRGTFRDTPFKDSRTGGLWDVYPDHGFGVLSAWAWGYHRCIDLVETIDLIDSEKIAVTGHSRGGKAALVAGATDERIGITNDNGSCAGGSAAYRYVGDGGETLNILNVFPTWFGTDIRQYLDKEDAMPFDQHCLMAAIAPRPLLSTYGLDDRWSNPEGMVQAHAAVREAYRFLGAPDNLVFHLRPGPHEQNINDWQALLDYIGLHWQGKKPSREFNIHPYDHLEPVFSWKAPA